jgi:thiamine pyrophosphate-dependent acetolactate synthase large subunit-like protein
MLARAFGGEGERVDKPADVRAALKRGLEAIGKGRLALVHMVLPPINQ